MPPVTFTYDEQHGFRLEAFDPFPGILLDFREYLQNFPRANAALSPARLFEDVIKTKLEPRPRSARGGPGDSSSM